MNSSVRILLLADTHLGFDAPQRPRIVRRRRGPDFFANFERALEPALAGNVDIVVHGGDLLYRSRVPPSLVHQAVAPLKRVADSGVPVYLVPGNHERSAIPFAMLALHERIHIFDRPRTFRLNVRGMPVALAGFPCCRREARSRFKELLEATRWRDAKADVRILCVHQAFEGATVGPSDYVFRSGSDVIRAGDTPPQFAAVLAGHIHRHQVLTKDLRGRPCPAPVLYPGSIERTAFAEKDETKGYLRLEVVPERQVGRPLVNWAFHPLPARPMVVTDLAACDERTGGFDAQVRQAIDSAPRDAVLRLRIHGDLDERGRRVVAAANLRSLAPPTMNVEAVLVDERRSHKSAVRDASSSDISLRMPHS